MTPPRTRLRPSALRGAIIPLACVAGAVAGTFGVGVGASPAAAARIEVGVYQDNPVAGIPALTKVVGRRSTRVISTYVTGGKLVEPSVVALARRTHARLLVSWMPDGGKEGAKQPRFKLSRVRRGAQNRGAGGPDQAAPRAEARADPAPDAGAQHALVRLVGHGQRQHPGGLRRGLEAGAQGREERRRQADPAAVGALRPQRSRRRPRTPSPPTSRAPPRSIWWGRADTTSAPRADWPGPSPPPSSRTPIARSRPSSPAPFWIAETGSTSIGGSKVQWIGQLGSLQTAIPGLAGLVWFDVRDRNGDFRIGAKKNTRLAFSKFVFRRPALSPRLDPRRGAAVSRGRCPAGPRPR